MELLSQVITAETTRGKHTFDVQGKHVWKGELMNTEWARFQSFAKFPIDSVARPIRLAQAGFYYSGTSEEVICFCCGMRNGVWTEDETAVEVHGRLSPNCRFICGEETSNIAIHGENRLKPATNCSNASESITGDKKDETSKILSLQATDSTRSITFQTSQTENNISTEALTNSYKSHNNKDTELRGTVVNGQIERYPGIRGSKPKHPDYSLLCTRQRSFSLWPENHEIDPEILSKAGFFFAGMEDCVRCFFCGGGMKNWESGDNPWIEHAKWFPNCEYVKLCKGESFTNLCAIANCSDNVVLNESLKHAEIIPDDQSILDFNCVAAKLVLTMGYGQIDVENGLKCARQKYGSLEMKAHYIIEYLHENNKQVPKKQQLTNKSIETSEDDSHIASGGAKNNLNMTVNEFSGRNNVRTSKSEKESLLEENRRLKDLLTCKICLNKEAVVAFLPCGHLTSCVECAKYLKNCAICRKNIAATVRVYQA